MIFIGKRALLILLAAIAAVGLAGPALGAGPLLWAQEGGRAAAPRSGEDVEAGKRLYQRHCAQCHGIEGMGNGPAADYLEARPRDFTLAQYKIRSTMSGELPTDRDIFDIITKGMEFKGMPGWANLTEKERWQLVAYMKTFNPDFGQWELEEVDIGESIPASGESIAKGKELYQTLKCWECHGQEGRGDGPSAPNLTDDLGKPIRTADLTKGWTFIGGSSTRDVAKAFATGLNGTPMPSYADTLSEEDMWHLANYVKSLSRGESKFEAVLRSGKVSQAMGLDPDDPMWDSVPSIDIRMAGQVIVEPRWFRPTVRDITVRSVYNEEEVALLISWHDPSESAALPREGEKSSEEQPDAVALQFPQGDPAGPERPYFIMGDPAKGVNLWKWDAKENRCVEHDAFGHHHVIAQGEGEQDVQCKGRYSQGEWRVVMKRRLLLPVGSKDVHLTPGRFLPIAFFAWDGSNGERDVQCSLSSWYYILLEPPKPIKIYLYPLMAAGVVAALEWRLLRRRGRIPIRRSRLSETT